MSSSVRAPGGGSKKSDLAVGDDSIKRVHPPAELLDQFAKDCWKENSRILIERKTYSREDAILLMTYCNAFSMMITCDKQMNGTYTEESGQGGLKKHPLVNVRNDAVSQVARIGSLLGLNPLSRARFLQGGNDSDPSENEFDEF